jgi:hypothetical protein
MYLRHYLPEAKRIPQTTEAIKSQYLNYQNKFDSKNNPRNPEFRPARVKGKEMAHSASLNILGHENNRLNKVLEDNKWLNPEKLDANMLHHHDFRPKDKRKWLAHVSEICDYKS